MRWKYNPPTIYDKVKKRFAIFPTLVQTTPNTYQWVWMESYYVYSEETYGGTCVTMFSNYIDMEEWLTTYENS